MYVGYRKSLIEEARAASCLYNLFRSLGPWLNTGGH